MPEHRLTIISGGQTGVDRAAWDAARSLGLAIGGWVPHGRRAEDGVIPPEYAPLRETDDSGYRDRTERNVRDSDATLILFRDGLTGGTLYTATVCAQEGRPRLQIDLAATDQEAAAMRIHGWIVTQGPRRLNVAGPRASGDPDLYLDARAVLTRALSRGVRP